MPDTGVCWGLTDDFTDLVLHALAHVPLDEAGNLYSPHYVAWAAEHTPVDERRWLQEAAGVLRSAWSTGAPPIVHAWPELFGSIEGMLASGADPVASLRPARVRDAAVLTRLQAIEGPEVELLHATLCALAPWFSRWRGELEPSLRRAVERVDPWLREAATLRPELAEARVELSMALGIRGRGFRDRIVVGAPLIWNRLDGSAPAVLAMHELLVHQSRARGYVEQEWTALTQLSAIMIGASESLRVAHAAWLSSLELRPLLDALRRAGRIDEAMHHQLLDEPESRAAALVDAPT